MSQPESNGLFEVFTARPQKERGFFCMKLTEFRHRDDITDSDRYFAISEQAAAGNCPYKSECPIYEMSFTKLRKKGIQLALPFED